MVSVAAWSERKGLGRFGRARLGPFDQFGQQQLLLPQDHKHFRRRRRRIAYDNFGGIAGRELQGENQNPRRGQTGPGLRVMPENGQELGYES